MPSSKCLTKIVPLGHVHSPVEENEAVVPVARPAQRCLNAASDHSGALTVYGTRPAVGTMLAVLEKTPAADKVAGIAPRLVVGM